MISLVVPTRNRSYTLRKVLPSYLTQEQVSEIVIVDDAGTDDTRAVVDAAALAHPAVAVRYLRHGERQGAARSRQAGAAAAVNDHVLFCDDDEYLEPGYAAECLRLLVAEGAGAVSGRRVYMRTGETRAAALARFGDGLRRVAPFNYRLCETVNGAVFRGVVSLPLTNSNILTTRALVMRFGFDPHYRAGNGYREESDFQMALFLAGWPVLASNDAHSLHLPLGEVRTGGQRVRRWRKFAWSVRYNGYFLDKYYPAYAVVVGLTQPLWLAKARAALYLAWRTFLRPQLHAAVMAARYGAAR